MQYTSSQLFNRIAVQLVNNNLKGQFAVCFQRNHHAQRKTTYQVHKALQIKCQSFSMHSQVHSLPVTSMLTCFGSFADHFVRSGHVHDLSAPTEQQTRFKILLIVHQQIPQNLLSPCAAQSPFPLRNPCTSDLGGQGLPPPPPHHSKNCSKRTSFNKPLTISPVYLFGLSLFLEVVKPI